MLLDFKKRCHDGAGSAAEAYRGGIFALGMRPSANRATTTSQVALACRKRDAEVGMEAGNQSVIAQLHSPQDVGALRASSLVKTANGIGIGRARGEEGSEVA